MIQLSRWKIILVVASAIIGCLLAYPNLLSPAQREALPGWLPKNALNLGLDLQGGSYLLLEVDVPAMREKRVTNLIEDVRVTLNGEGIATNGLQREAGGVDMPKVVEVLRAGGIQLQQRPLPDGARRRLVLRVLFAGVRWRRWRFVLRWLRRRWRC